MLYKMMRRTRSAIGRNLEKLFPAAIEQISDPVRRRYADRKGFIIADLICGSLPTQERFCILDGGAREALADPRWQAFDNGRVTLYGFEPDGKEVDELNKTANERGLDYRYYAGALWSKPSKLTFFENKAPGGGSFYPQNVDVTSRWKFENHQEKFYARDIFFPTGTSQWEMTSIDQWAAGFDKVFDLDFMKLNVQGAELEILKGAESVLDQVLGLMVEISFVESYRKRPFFADIDTYLRAKNFYFFDLIGHHYIGRADSPITVRHMAGLYPLWGQLIEGHGIYLRDPIDMERKGLSIGHMTKDKILKLTALAEVFGQVEYAFELLSWLIGLLQRRGDQRGAGQVCDILESAKDSYARYLS